MRALAPLLTALAILALVVAGVTTRLATRDEARPPAPAHAPDPPAAVRALPSTIPGYATGPVGLDSFRLSLVVRTRTTLLNGLAGSASDYVVEVATADRGRRQGLLVGVAARSGASPPPIAADVEDVVGGAAVARGRVAGRPVAVHRGTGHWLAVVDDGPRRAVVVIAGDRAQATALAGAVARALAGG